MDLETNLDRIKNYFERTLDAHGPIPQGVDWNSEAAQQVRFDQLIKVIQPPLGSGEAFTLNDYGCGYGSLAGYLLKRDDSFGYFGYDISEKMISQAQAIYSGCSRCVFTTQESALPVSDYTVASGVFNIRFDASPEEWTTYILQKLRKINEISAKGFAFNLLTRYSDPERMRPDLYYADPGFFFDTCKTHFSRNVALLHDYDLYDFTVIVRKLLR